MTWRRAALVALGVAAAAAGPAAAQTATSGTPQALFTRLIGEDTKTSKEIRDALKARRLFVDADVTFADLTGDGRDDAIARVDSGGAAGALAVYVFSTDGAKKLRAIYRSQRLYRALATPEGAALTVRTPRYGAGDDVCCPGAVVERTLSWSARAKRLVLRSTRTTPV